MLLFFVGFQQQAGSATVPAVRATETVTVRASEAALLQESAVAQHVLTADGIARVLLPNAAVGFTDLVTRTTPGVSADSNGFAHPLGEHADTALSLDGQPITDQQAKVFANQLDPAIIASLTAIIGAPPAEFGDKTSLALDIRTRSGLAQHANGMFSADYGSFGTSSLHAVVAGGNARFGQFVAAGINRSGRFLDTPEFRPLHDRGDGQTLFYRADLQASPADAVRLSLGAARSWFETPNTYDSAAAGQDQRSEIRSTNLSLGWLHTVSPSLITLAVPFVRHDHAQYYPSANPLRDTSATLAQDRTLTNAGIRTDTTYSRGPVTAKAGVVYQHTLLNERFDVGLTDPLFNAPCLDTQGDPLVTCTASSQPNPDFQPQLLPYDLSRGGSLFHFNGSANIQQLALFAQAEVRAGRWLLSPGLRYDIYNGLSRGRQVQPRMGVSFRALGATVLRVSYARLYQTPYNENLVFANDHTAANPFATNRSAAVRPGTRNQFNAGFEQGFGSHVSVSADYYWKFTRGDFDFDTLFNTPITFSVAWRKSKIDGFAIAAHLLEWHGMTADTVMGHTRSRFFTPQTGGLVFNSTPDVPVFRIDHGEEFEHTTDFHYRLPALHAHRISAGVTWRYNSGLALPDTVPTFTDALRLTADEQAQMGLYCGTQRATPSMPIRSCAQQQVGAERVRIPALGTQDADRNPVRVSPRHLIDLQLADEHVLQMERVTIGLHAAVLNVTNRIALYNFLSTFSGTHFVAPRTLQFGITASF